MLGREPHRRQTRALGLLPDSYSDLGLDPRRVAPYVLAPSLGCRPQLRGLRATREGLGLLSGTAFANGHSHKPMIKASQAIPPGRPPSPQDVVPLGDANISRRGRALILVVERDPDVRELESYFLNEAGFDVNFAADGAEALEQARALRPDIVITEVLVPKLDGLALCRAIKADPLLHSTVVLVFSILAVHLRASEAGADAFLMKPLAERRLVDTVRQLLLLRSASGRGGEIA